MSSPDSESPPDLGPPGADAGGAEPRRSPRSASELDALREQSRERAHRILARQAWVDERRAALWARIERLGELGCPPPLRVGGPGAATGEAEPPRALEEVLRLIAEQLGLATPARDGASAEEPAEEAMIEAVD